MNKIQMNASVSPELRTDIQEMSLRLNLTASDSLSLVPVALFELEQRIKSSLLALLSGEPTQIPLCDLFSFYGVNPNVFTAVDGDFFNELVSEASFDTLYRKEFLSRGGAVVIKLLDVLTGSAFCDLYTTDSAGLPFAPTWFEFPNLWNKVTKLLRSFDGVWNEDIPMMIECQLMGTLKKGSRSSGFTGK